MIAADVRVRDLMRRALFTCPPRTTLGQAAAQLRRRRVHALVVTDEAGAPRGILSDVDLLAGEWLSSNPAALEAMRAMTAGELMSAPVQTIDAGELVSEAVRRMLTDRIHRLVVIDNRSAVGVISVSDVVAHLAVASAERRTVADLMSHGLVVCRTDATLAQVARAMTERRSRSVVVVDARGAPQGVVTGWDLIAADPNQAATARDVMHPPIAVAASASLQAAAELMLKHHIHRLVVVDPDDPQAMPLGLITTSDIVAQMAGPGSVWQAR